MTKEFESHPLAHYGEKSLRKVEKFEREISKKRKAIHRKMKKRHNVRGLNIEAVEEYMDRNSVSPHRYYVLDEDDREFAIKYMDGVLERDRDYSNLGGRAYHQEGVALVFRDREDEEHNGPSVTEGAIVHELYHMGTNHLSVFHRDDGTAIMSRRGFVTYDTDGESRGHFFEEGAADLSRKQYIQEREGHVNGFYSDYDIDPPPYLPYSIEGKEIHIPLPI